MKVLEGRGGRASSLNDGHRQSEASFRERKKKHVQSGCQKKLVSHVD